MPSLSFDIAGSQIDGARDYQEDAFLITHLSDSESDSAGSLVIVADGMGGHAAGNVASNMAVQSFNRHLSKNFPSNAIADVLHDAVLQANHAIQATVAETAALKGMGCTLVACVMTRGELYLTSVGDSHLYLLRDGELVKRNADHSYGGFLDRMAAAGTPIEAEAGYSRNMLMSALTGDEIAEVDCPQDPLELAPGDRIILASDGLDTLPNDEVLKVCLAADSAKRCVDALLKAVTDAGAPRQDNTTVVVVDVNEKPGAAAAAELPPEQAEPLPHAAVDDEPETVPAGPTGGVLRPQLEIDTADSASRSSRSLTLLGLAVVLILIASGAAWLLMRDDTTPTPPIIVDEPLNADSDIVELEPVVDETPTPAEVARQARPQAEGAAVAEPAPISATTTAAPAPSDPFRDALRSGGTGPLMMPIPAGSFTMGGHLATDPPDQFPQHTVRVEAFAMSAYEITVAEFQRYAKATAAKMPPVLDTPGADAATFPMVYVSWDDALAYTRWLSEQTGKNYRLPSEAQWEYAARGGSGTPFWWGRNLGSGNAHCFTCDTGLDPRRATAVGRFKPNPFGLYDTAGNVQEWVYDCYHLDYQGAPTDGSVFEGGNCSVRVLRGGGFASGPEKLRSGSRDTFRPDKGNDQTGIRVIRVP